jgi:hypothetical protein
VGTDDDFGLNDTELADSHTGSDDRVG